MYVYEYLDKITNEKITYYSTLAIINRVGISNGTLSKRFKQGNNVIDSNEWRIERSVPAKDKIETIKREKKSTNRYFLENLSSEEYHNWLKEKEERKRIYEWKLNHSFKEEESPSERAKKEKWEKHCEQTCIRSQDDKVWIPRSILNEFPSLENYTLPKSMQ